jgi:CheY-like chemotaxis protein
VQRRTTSCQKLLYFSFEAAGAKSQSNKDKKGCGAGDSSNNENSQALLGLEKKRIVLVDDDSLVRSMFEKTLVAHGFDVVASMQDGDEIVNTIHRLNPLPDVILLDERMPRMSGVEACKIIHAKYPQISIIFVSADESAKQRSKDAGASGFLSKPVNLKDLLYALDSA